jgi:hypothetical protein
MPSIPPRFQLLPLASPRAKRGADVREPPYASIQLVSFIKNPRAPSARVYDYSFPFLRWTALPSCWAPSTQSCRLLRCQGLAFCSTTIGWKAPPSRRQGYRLELECPRPCHLATHWNIFRAEATIRAHPPGHPGIMQSFGGRFRGERLWNLNPWPSPRLGYYDLSTWTQEYFDQWIL